MTTTKEIFKGYKSKLLATRWGYDLYHQRYTEYLWHFIETNGVNRSYHYDFDIQDKYRIECELQGCKKKFILITIIDKELAITKYKR